VLSDGHEQHRRLQVYDLDTNIDVIKHHGSTDPLILVGILMHHGIAKEEVPAPLPNSGLVGNGDYVFICGSQTACASAGYTRGRLRTIQTAHDARLCKEMRCTLSPLLGRFLRPEMRCGSCSGQRLLIARARTVSLQGNQHLAAGRLQCRFSAPTLPLAALHWRPKPYVSL